LHPAAAYWSVLQLILKWLTRKARQARSLSPPATLGELREGDQGIIESIGLTGDGGRRLMELGFLPGSSVTCARSAPSGDPLVFRVDGAEIALRRETAAFLRLRTAAQAGD
jgi:ferrous iron transport protein A